MKTVKYLIPLWAAVVVYVVTSSLWGPRGFSAYDQLLMEQEKEQTNMAALRLTSQELNNTQNALRSDQDTLTLLARDLGYAPPGQRFARIIGWSGPARSPANPGRALKAGIPDHIPLIMLQIISLCVGAGMLMAIGLWDLLRFCQRRSGRA